MWMGRAKLYIPGKIGRATFIGSLHIGRGKEGLSVRLVRSRLVLIQVIYIGEDMIVTIPYASTESLFIQGNGIAVRS